MVNVKVIGAYVNGQGPGSIVSVDEKSAKYLERIGYGEIVEVEEPKVQAEESKPKRQPRKKKADTK